MLDVSKGEVAGKRFCLRSAAVLARALSSPSSRDWDARVSVLGFDFLFWLVSRDLNAGLLFLILRASQMPLFVRGL